MHISMLMRFKQLDIFDVKFDEFEIDAMSITAHKFGGPKGVGALLVKDHVTLDYPQLGGEQELKRRAGAENLAQE